MKLIQTIEVGAGGAAAIEFTSIPGTYTDLLLLLSGRSTNASHDPVFVTFNSNSANYSYVSIWGTGSSVQSFSGSSLANVEIQYLPSTAQTSSTFNNAGIYIANYAGSSSKSVSVDPVSENNGTTAYQIPMNWLWANSAAITTIKLDPANGNFAQYSSASLYGILKGSGGADAA